MQKQTVITEADTNHGKVPLILTDSNVQIPDQGFGDPNLGINTLEVTQEFLPEKVSKAVIETKFPFEALGK